MFIFAETTNNKIMLLKEIDLQLSDVVCDIQGLRTHETYHYFDNKKGGMVTKKRKLKRPKIIINFSATTNEYLSTGSHYTDGINNFVAIDGNKIVNTNTDIETFVIPKKITLIGSAYGE